MGRRGGPQRKSELLRFREKYRVDKKTGCWVWIAAKHERGYGRLRFRGRQAGATRVSWLLRHGTWPPEDQFLCHKCDNPACVNPEHLFLGTAKENNQDRAQKHGLGRLPQLFEERLIESVRAEAALADLFGAKTVTATDVNADPDRAVATMIAQDLGKIWKVLVCRDGLAFANARQGVAVAMNALRPLLDGGPKS